MTLSEHIKQKRKKNGLSQVELAERAGVGLRFVRDLEQGKQTLRMDKVNDVLALFGECLGPVKTEMIIPNRPYAANVGAGPYTGKSPSYPTPLPLPLMGGAGVGSVTL